jgi:hypothetical protein
MAKYLLIESDNTTQVNEISDEDLEAVVDENLRVFRVNNSRFEELLVEAVENDDGETEYTETWTLA